MHIMYMSYYAYAVFVFVRHIFSIMIYSIYINMYIEVRRIIAIMATVTHHHDVIISQASCLCVSVAFFHISYRAFPPLWLTSSGAVAMAMETWRSILAACLNDLDARFKLEGGHVVAPKNGVKFGDQSQEVLQYQISIPQAANESSEMCRSFKSM